MLFQATLYVILTGMVICLWMAFYLFARGFPSKMTTRGAVLLISLGAFFFSAYNNLFEQIPGTAAWRAAFLITGLGAWHNITLSLLPETAQRRSLILTTGIYLLGITTIFLLFTSKDSFIGEQGNLLYVARIGVGIPFILYGIYEIVVLGSIHYNLLAYDRVGLTSAGRYFLFSSIFALCGVLYGIVALALAPPMPRVIQDLMVFLGVFAIGVSVARHQSLVERRTTLQDFPVATLTILVIVIAYIFIAVRLELPPRLLGPIIVFVVLTHALYDLVREFLERLRIRNESQFRRQIRELENEGTANTLQPRLEQGLDLLCITLDSTSGFIAVREGDNFIVSASRNSVEKGSRLSASDVSFEDITNTQVEEVPNIYNFAPSFDGQTQIAVIGIGKPNNRLDFSWGDLELFSEVADHIGTIVSLSNTKPQINQFLAQSELNETEAQSETGKLMDVIGKNPDPEFVKMVEEGLRNLPDYIALGQLPLADQLKIKADSHIERGRELQKVLKDCIELLRPAEKRPQEPLPRVWYNHAVLHDAYVEGVPNREIMARLYISEGTFNRTRRNAIRGLARLLMEKYFTN